MLEFLQPPGWPRPKGFSNGIAVEGAGKLVVLAGQIGNNEQGQIDSDDFAVQCRCAFRNIVTLVAQAGGSATDIVRLTWFVTDKQAYLASGRAVGEAYREIIGRHFPAMSVIFVSSLVDDRAKVEIEAIAFIGDH